jgi:hypothetical protein
MENEETNEDIYLDGVNCEYCWRTAVNGIDGILYCKDHKLDAETAAEIYALVEASGKGLFKFRHFEFEKWRLAGFVAVAPREIGLQLLLSWSERDGPDMAIFRISWQVAMVYGELQFNHCL